MCFLREPGEDIDSTGSVTDRGVFRFILTKFSGGLSGKELCQISLRIEKLLSIINLGGNNV